MIFYQSIRFRIVVSILLYGSLLVILNTGITFFVMGKSMSQMITNLIDTEVNTFKYKYEKDHTTPLPHSKYINMYKGPGELPERFRDLVSDLSPGVHAIFVPKRRPPIHVGVIDLADKEEPYYLLFHGHEFFKENALLNPRQILLVSLAMLLIPGAIIGYVTSRMLYKPVVKLMDQIRGLNPEEIPARLSENRSQNEIGRLTQTIEIAMTRIKSFIQREKQFTRDASHELRTPLTIVHGAVEIMEQQPEVEKNPLLSKPLNRISQSVRDMQTTIETFLWLAREDKVPDDTCRVEPVVRKAVDDNRYLIADKDLDVRVDVYDNKSVQAKEEILYITVINLIRNAFQFTAEGSVTITIDADHISITDTGAGIEADKLETITDPHIKGERSNGFGLGLSIVERLCNRFGWELLIKSKSGEGTEVMILWHDS